MTNTQDVNALSTLENGTREVSELFDAVRELSGIYKPKNRWQEFRAYDDSIPTNHFEAAYFIGNVKLHVKNTDPNWVKAWTVLNTAHEAINAAMESQAA